MYDIRMGQTLVNDHPLKRVNIKGKGAFAVEGQKNSPFNKELKDGVLVQKDNAGNWEIADTTPVHYGDPTSGQYYDLHNNVGIWKDKGILFMKNGKIDAGEVTPLEKIFDSFHELGWVGSDLVGAHLGGTVKNAWIEAVNGVPSLSLMTRVENKHYINYGSADLDPVAEMYIQNSEAKDRQFLNQQ